MTRTEGEPHSRLTDLADRIVQAFPEVEREGLRAIVLLQDGAEGGVAMYGYEDDMGVATDLIVHVAAILHEHGKRLVVLPLPPVGHG